MESYLDVTVRISAENEARPGGDASRPAQYRVFVESQQGQGESTLVLPFALRELAGIVFGVAETTRDLERGPGPAPVDGRSPREFGELLYDALFTGMARTILDKTIAVAGERQTGVRIRLSMDLKGQGMTDVASLPWELMCPRDESPLVVSTKTALVRSLDLPQRTEPTKYQPPLRIMALMSNPTGTAELNLDEERRKIEQNWASLDVQVDFVRPVRQTIRRALAEPGADYHVIHFMGHGAFDVVKGGTLLLEHEDRSADPITGDELAVMLKDEPLRLVFLNACKTGMTSAGGEVHPFAGIATALIRSGVPAVVAMQFPISDQAAIVFAQTFYERISQRFAVDAAVSEGRKALYSDGRAEWATPVLFLRSTDGVLFQSSIARETERSARPSHQAQGSATAIAPEVEDPWGPAAADVFRVFLATPDQDREKLHGQLSKVLRELDWVRVVDSVPLGDADKHADVVGNLLRRADLSVHLLGANPGRRLDVDDGDPLRTYPLEQLRLGLKAGRPQLVLVPAEDKASITNPHYAERVRELENLPRGNAERFELVCTDRNQLKEALLNKLQKLKDARQAALAQGTLGEQVQQVFVDAHDIDQDSAIDLVVCLKERNIDAVMQTTDGSSADALADFGVNLSKFPLYIIVAGSADRAWVTNREKAAMKSAATSRLAILIAKYLATPVEGGDSVEASTARIKIVSALKRKLPNSIDDLFAPSGAGPQ